MLRLSWPSLLLGALLIILLARRPGLLFSRAFFPVLLVAGIFMLVTYRRRPGRPGRPVARTGEAVAVPRWLQIDAPLPPSGLARWATIAALAVSGLIAALVVVIGAAILWSVLTG